MSSIERAMDKLGGDASDEADEPAPAKATRADATADKPARDGTPEPVAGAAQPAAAEVDSTLLRDPAPAADRTPLADAPAPAPPQAAASATAVAAPPIAPAPAETSKNYVTLDFERLAAAGHMVPDASVITRASEEYQQIKRRLLGNMVEGILNTPRPKNLIMVTSSLPSEGKTFTSVNLALSMTMEVDHTILAVDTDIVKRDLSRAFGVEGYPGLYDLLGDDSLRLEDLLIRTSIPNLVILPAGQDRDASTERLASAQMRALTDELAGRYSDRVVLFDSPPILATTTATALAPLVGQLVIVVEAARTKQETVRDSLQRLEGVRITGMILNKSRQPATRAYDYYGYYYRPE